MNDNYPHFTTGLSSNSVALEESEKLEKTSKKKSLTYERYWIRFSSLLTYGLVKISKKSLIITNFGNTLLKSSNKQYLLHKYIIDKKLKGTKYLDICLACIKEWVKLPTNKRKSIISFATALRSSDLEINDKSFKIFSEFSESVSKSINKKYPKDKVSDICFNFLNSNIITQKQIMNIPVKDIKKYLKEKDKN